MVARTSNLLIHCLMDSYFSETLVCFIKPRSKSSTNPSRLCVCEIPNKHWHKYLKTSHYYLKSQLSLIKHVLCYQYGQSVSVNLSNNNQSCFSSLTLKCVSCFSLPFVHERSTWTQGFKKVLSYWWKRGQKHEKYVHITLF